MVRFIHSSDWQIGMTRHFLRGEAQARFTQDRIDAIRTLGQLARKHDARFIVVAGDVFESNQLSLQLLQRALDAMEEAQVPLFLLPGNHDPLDAGSLYRSKLFRERPGNVMLLDDMTPRKVAGLPGVEVVGAPWRSKRPLEDLVAALGAQTPPAAGTVRVAVAHGQVDIMTPERRPDTLSLSAAEAALEQGQWHYLALGDRHSLTKVGNSGAIWYSGAPEATDFAEVRPGYALLVEINGDRLPRLTELALGRWRFIDAHRFINGMEDIEALESWLSSLPDKAWSIVKLRFEGSVNLAGWSELQRLLESQAPRFASLRQRTATTEMALVPDVLDEDAAALSGYAKRAWLELVTAAEEGDTEARDALALFYRLAQGGQGE